MAVVAQRRLAFVPLGASEGDSPCADSIVEQLERTSSLEVTDWAVLVRSTNGAFECDERRDRGADDDDLWRWLVCTGLRAPPSRTGLSQSFVEEVLDEVPLGGRVLAAILTFGDWIEAVPRALENIHTRLIYGTLPERPQGDRS
jgi:hypothetical protein